MGKTYECFCGEKFPHFTAFCDHFKTCEIYQQMKQIYLSATNIHYMLTIRKNTKDNLRKVYPYSMFSYGDYQDVVKGYPHRSRMKDGTYLTVDEVNAILNKDRLTDMYVNQKLDAVDIMNAFGNRFSISTIFRALDTWGIQIRDKSEATKNSIGKMEAGCIKSLGVTNPSKSQKVKDSKIATALKHSDGKFTHHFKNPDKVKEMADNLEETYGEGIRNASSIPGVQDKKDNTCFRNHKVKNIFEKVDYIADCTFKKTGYRNASKDPKVKLKKFLKHEETAENGVNYSKDSVELFSTLIPYFDESVSRKFKFATHGREAYLNGDIFCSIDFSYTDIDHKLAIEYNGDVWHANPVIYKDTDHPNFENKSLTSKDIWEHDKKRLDFIRSCGYKVLVVWEYDYKKDKDRVVSECVDFIKCCLSEQKKDLVQEIKDVIEHETVH